MFNFFTKTDSQIEQDIITELNWDPSVNAHEIRVTASDGVVTLRGSVPHYFEKLRAQEAAQRVGGVRAVADELEVNIMGSYIRSDEQIAEVALSALQGSFVDLKGIKLVVEKGWITLKGEVDWDYQRSAAVDTVKHLMGVRGVSNNISIQTKTKPADLQSLIEKALKRSAIRAGNDISVSVEGSTATLGGNVHSKGEFEDAEHAVWMAPGITSVENNIRIVDERE